MPLGRPSRRGRLVGEADDRALVGVVVLGWARTRRHQLDGLEGGRRRPPGSCPARPAGTGTRVGPRDTSTAACALLELRAGRRLEASTWPGSVPSRRLLGLDLPAEGLDGLRASSNWAPTSVSAPCATAWRLHVGPAADHAEDHGHADHQGAEHEPADAAVAGDRPRRGSRWPVSHGRGPGGRPRAAGGRHRPMTAVASGASSARHPLDHGGRSHPARGPTRGRRGGARRRRPPPPATAATPGAVRPATDPAAWCRARRLGTSGSSVPVSGSGSGRRAGGRRHQALAQAGGVQPLGRVEPPGARHDRRQRAELVGHLERVVEAGHQRADGGVGR